MNHTGSLRWRIALLIAAAIAISYFDRQTLPVAIKSIQLEIPISNTQFSQLQAAFLTAYALMYAGGGKLVDVLGTRMGFLLIMAVVGGLRQSRPGHWFRNAHDEPLSARHGRRGRFPRGHQGGVGMVSGGRALDGHGDHQRGHVGGSGGGAAADRHHAGHLEQALGLLPLRRRRAGVGNLVVVGVFHASQPAASGSRTGNKLDRPVSFSAGVGLGLRQVSERRGLVFLPVLAAQVLVRCATLRHQTGRLFRLDSVCGGGRRQPARRLVFEPAHSARPLSGLLAKAGPGRQRGGDAADLLRDAIAGPDCHRAVQHRVCRAAIWTGDCVTKKISGITAALAPRASFREKSRERPR